SYDQVRMQERRQQRDELLSRLQQRGEVARKVTGGHRQWPGTDLVRMSTREPATSTPMVPTTIRWIHCLAASAECDSTAVIFQMNAKMKASAPIEATSACAMWVHVVISSVIGVMSGPAAARNGMSATSWWDDRRLGRERLTWNPAC